MGDCKDYHKLFSFTLQCPAVIYQCPMMVRNQCPTVICQYPMVRNQCPMVICQCPLVRNECPMVICQCPLVRNQCPTVICQCPMVRNQYPLVICQYPTVIHQCPLVRNQCPTVIHQCPLVRNQCPTVIRQCPLAVHHDGTPSPGDHENFCHQDTKAPSFFLRGPSRSSRLYNKPLGASLCLRAFVAIFMAERKLHQVFSFFL